MSFNFDFFKFLQKLGYDTIYQDTIIFHQCKFKGCSFDYFSMIRSFDMEAWYSLMLVCFSTKFGGCNILESCATKFLHVTWHVGIVVFRLDTHFHHVWWLQPLQKLRYDVFHLSRDTWSNVMPSIGWVLFHCSHKIWFKYRIVLKQLCFSLRGKIPLRGNSVCILFISSDRIIIVQLNFAALIQVSIETFWNSYT